MGGVEEGIKGGGKERQKGMRYEEVKAVRGGGVKGSGRRGKRITVGKEKMGEKGES